MDRTTACLDFAVIGHQDNWLKIAGFINHIRGSQQQALSPEKIREIFGFIPATDLFKVQVNSATGASIHGVYIDTFIDPDKLDISFSKKNLSKVIRAAAHAKKLGANIVALGGFTSIVLEGKPNLLSTGSTKFTTGNTLTAAYIAKGVEKAAMMRGKNLNGCSVLIIGATGDIGMACVNYFKGRVKKLLLCARNNLRLQQQGQQLISEDIAVEYSADIEQLAPKADIIISVSSSVGIKIGNLKENALVCDAGYPKNLETTMEINSGPNLFHGGMGQVREGFSFNPDYSATMYAYPAPNIIHGCILEAMVLAFEKRFENYSAGRGNITIEKMEKIYDLGTKHGIDIAPFYNQHGLWNA